LFAATHCVQKGHSVLHEENFIALLGVHDLNQLSEATPAKVQSIQVHPDWNPRSKLFDANLAILVLKDPVEFSQFIKPVCLLDPTSDLSFNMKGIVVGYGSSENSDSSHEVIPKSINVPILSDDDCSDESPIISRLLSSSTFCGGKNTGTGICAGDAGAGLFVTDGDTFYLRGVVPVPLKRRNLCINNSFSIFVDILKFYNWLSGNES